MADTPRTAVYAGTFDPITNGHKDIIVRALKVFDRLVVAVAENTSKSSLFSLDERVEMVSAALADVAGDVVVDRFEGMLVDFVKEKKASVIIRGLRAVSDYEYEAQMAVINRQLSSEIETVFFVTSQRCSYISSSIVKNVAKNGGDISELVPSNVAKRLKAVYSA